MNSKTIIRRIAATQLFAALLLSAACSKESSRAETPLSATEQPAIATKSETDALVARIGVEPGPVEQKDAPAAVLARVSGTVELRRLGEETYSAAKQDDALYPGDQLRAAQGAQAIVLFPDASTAELAEVSTLAIGSRAASADPASSAAVLAGVSRFSVSPRAPGEGPFIVFTPAGLVATKGTVFGVGVAADGDARVGVESGAVEVAGAAALDAPVELNASHALELSAAGKLAAPAPWPADDWGMWRDQAEANVDVAATATLHTDAMAALSAELTRGYEAVAELGAELARFEAEASAKESAQDSAGYRAELGAGSIAIDASFLAALRLEWLTHAYVSRAVLAEELYVRHPEVVVWAKLEPFAHAAVLWPKRFDATSVAVLEPLRVQYYLHHPRGRAHAQLVGISVPAFYASVTPPELPSVKVRKKLHFKVFTPPSVQVTATARPVWIAAPSAGWHAKLKAEAAPPRAKAGFWIRPPSLKSKAMLGADVKGKMASGFAVRAPEPRGRLKAKWGFALGHKIKVAPPDLDAAAKARASWTLAAAAPHAEADTQRELNGKLELPDAKAKLNAKSKAKLDLPAPKLKLDAKSKVKAGASAGADAKAEAKAGAQFKIKAPEVKPPTFKAQGKVGAKLKFGK